MRSIILEYAERPRNKTSQIPKTKYSYTKNMNVLEKSGETIFEKLKLDTNTFTKVQGESTDSDQNLELYCDTQTLTLVNTEGTDSDNNDNILLLCDTMTHTRIQSEGSDFDK